MSKKLVLFGCKDTTLHVAKSLKEIGYEITLVTISPQKGIEQEVAGYTDLSSYKELFSIIYVADRYDLSQTIDADFFKSNHCEIGIAIGWQRLIPGEILNMFKIGVFGMHGSAQDLPYGRGRSPMNWSLIEGRQWFYTNLFKYQNGVDDGPIVDTDCFSINQFDTAESLHYKNTLSLINLLKRNWPKFINTNFVLKPQKDGVGSYYPKRSPSDGLIDWSDFIFNIEKLVRAVTKPFYGAIGFIENKELRIYRCAPFYTDLESHHFKEMVYGEICDIFPNGKFLVRCNGGVLLIHEYEVNQLNLRVGMIFDLETQKNKKTFTRNKHGFFDTN